MRKHKIIPLLLVASTCVVAVASVAAADEYRGTFAERMACTPDVFRLCSSEMPDVSRIVACLKQNEQQLGGPCRAVFESNAQATPGDVTTGSGSGPVRTAPAQVGGTAAPVDAQVVRAPPRQQ